VSAETRRRGVDHWRPSLPLRRAPDPMHAACFGKGRGLPETKTKTFLARLVRKGAAVLLSTRAGVKRGANRLPRRRERRRGSAAQWAQRRRRGWPRWSHGLGRRRRPCSVAAAVCFSATPGPAAAAARAVLVRC
jgi:hypothetical protein